MHAVNFCFLVVQFGHPYVIADFGGGDAWKTVIALDEASEDGTKLAMN